MPRKDEQPVRCSFCGKTEKQARLIAGPGVYICSDCVEACRQLLQEDQKAAAQEKQASEERLPTPMEMKTFMDGYIIGQEEAKIALSVAVYNHYKRIYFGGGEDVELQKSNILMIGPTGSGKSTLVNLIPRFYDVSGGRILIDGVDIKNMSMRTLHEKIGFIPQSAFLFSGTVADNLRMGKPDATEEEMWEALETAQAADFVRAMPDGLDSELSQNGKNLSGGQRQRLAIARVLIRKAEIYVFDDSFSALDFSTDAKLRKALRERMPDITKIIVAQRVGTIIDASRIIVLDEGKVAGIGTHRELLENCTVYREIAQSQLSKEELGA